MKIYNTLILAGLALFAFSCGNNTGDQKDLFSIEIKNAEKFYNNSETIIVSIKNKINKNIESVTYSFDTEKASLTGGNQETAIDLSGKKLGKRSLTASITADGNTYSISKELTLVAATTPKLYTYKILETYPHDIEAYTQGLEFMNDTLYESTGQYKSSSLRKTRYTTGEVLQKIPLDNQFFGEGITIFNNKIYQLTWKENTGFIYDLGTLERKGTFVYGKSKEGWGLCNNGAKIFKSDGTEKIWTLNAETLAEEDFIEIYTNTSKIKSVNELEWVEGKIYANVYERDAVAIVDPATGAVEGVIDFKGLKDKVTQHEKLNVLNGIAYKGEKNIIYVTGKNWDKLFKVEIIEK